MMNNLIIKCYLKLNNIKIIQYKLHFTFYKFTFYTVNKQL